MRDWGQRSSHGEKEINNNALKLESSPGPCDYGSNLHYGIASPIQGLRKEPGDRAYSFAQARQIRGRQRTVMRARVGHVSSVSVKRMRVRSARLIFGLTP